MIVIFEKKTNRIVGVASKVFDNGSWREPELAELYPDRNPNEIGYISIQDSPKYALKPDAWRLKLDAHGVPVGVERKPTLPKIHLHTDARDTDGDGLPELFADAKSKAVITVEVKDAMDRMVQEDVLLTLRTTGGTLSARRVQAKGGTASVELTASVETITVTVTVSAEGMQSGALTFEFMPPEA